MLSNKMKELELKERSSKSLLANVLDIDDDFRHSTNLSGSTTAIGTAGFGYDSWFIILNKYLKLKLFE